jgi:hypothetical protein
VRGLSLAAVCALAVLAGQHASASLSSPLAALFAGGIAAGIVMLAIVLIKPEALGPEAQLALSRVL